MIIYALLNLIPSQKMKMNDMILVISSLLIIIILIDNTGYEFFSNSKYSEIDIVSPASSPSSQDMPEITTNQIVNYEIPKTTCDLQLEQIKKDFEKQIENLKSELTVTNSSGTQSSTVKYYKQLIKELSSNGILDSIDIKNITTKLNSNLLTLDEAISSLEKVKEQGIVKEKNVGNDFVYSELPSEFYSPLGRRIVSDWENEYNLLDTNNWQVPMQRPPVCISSEKCKICPKETYPGTTLLKDWDSSRKITDVSINKKWASNN